MEFVTDLLFGDPDDAADAQIQASREASSASQQAQREANALAKEMFETTRADYAPYRQVGPNALATIVGGDVTQDPRAIFPNAVYTPGTAAIQAPAVQAPAPAAPQPALSNIMDDFYTDGNGNRWVWIGNGWHPATPENVAALDTWKTSTGGSIQNVLRNAFQRSQAPLPQSGTPRAASVGTTQGQTPGAGSYRVPGLLNDLSAVKRMPSYQFGLDEGNRNLLGSAAARGSIKSSATLRNLQKYGQDYGLSQWERYLDPYWKLVDIGRGATGSVSSAGQNYAGTAGANIINTGKDVSENLLNMGQARASAYGAKAAQGQNLLDTILTGAGIFWPRKKEV